MGSVEGRSVLITGAARGIGAATARAAAAEGARLVLCDVEAAGLQETAAATGGTAAVVDVRDEEAVAAVVAQTIEEHGRIDGAVNNAAILGTIARITDYPLETWRDVMDTDLTGVFVCLQHELRAMLAQGAGAVVNVASVAGLRGWGTASAYSAAKHGVVSLTRSAALECTGAGVRVNAVCPALTDTAMLQELVDHRGGGEDAWARAHQLSPIGRIARPEEVAQTIVWLLSDQASYVSGAALSVDGALTGR